MRKSHPSAQTARPTDRCTHCQRPLPEGGCSYHPEGWTPAGHVRSLYRAAMDAHAALPEAERAAVTLWVANVEVV